MQKQKSTPPWRSKLTPYQDEKSKILRNIFFRLLQMWFENMNFWCYITNNKES